MRFSQPLVRGTLLRRYKRFLADVRLEDGREVVAHCANPGAMLGIADPGLPVWLLPADSPKRALAWSWALVQVEDGLIGVNTGAPNTLVAEALAAGRIPELAVYPSRRREVRYGEASRIDLLLEGGDRPACYVEIKNVHLKRDGWAEFPDCVTLRGAKHMGELARMVEAGFRAVVLYVIQRTDCTRFRIAGDLDPGYHRALEAARKAGVEVLCYSCDISFEGVEIAGAIPFTP
jgi:sugar fermentation stimulation protein A